MNQTYSIRGMSCNSCKEKIEKKLKRKKGIIKAQVNLKTKSLELVYNTEIITLEEISRMVAVLGYELVGEADNFKRNIRYNLGRIISYTLLVGWE